MATYAVPARCGLGSIFCTRPPAASPFGVTFVHVLPSSRVMYTNPSLEPVQMTPFCTGDSRIAYSVLYTSSPVASRVMGMPLGSCGSPLGNAVRSGESFSHVTPSSRVRCRYCDP